MSEFTSNTADLTSRYGVYDVYSPLEYGPHGSFVIESVARDNAGNLPEIACGDDGYDPPRVARLGDFRAAGLMQLLDDPASFDDLGDDFVMGRDYLSAGIAAELHAACGRAEAACRWDDIERVVDANVGHLDGMMVIDISPRGFCNEREAVILDPAHLSAAREWCDGKADGNWSAAILTADEYADALREALAGADDPTTNPRSGVAELADFDDDGRVTGHDAREFDPSWND